MTNVQRSSRSAADARRVPVAPPQALQDAKRLEKMQTVCSSHRTSGTVALPTPRETEAPR